MDSRPSLPNDGGPFASMLRKSRLNTGRGTTYVRARLRSWSSMLQKIRPVKKTEIYCYAISCNLINDEKKKNIKRERKTY